MMTQSELLERYRRCVASLWDQEFYLAKVIASQCEPRLDPSVGTAAAEAVPGRPVRILFAPDFVASLTDEDFRFVLLHEVLHLVLDHIPWAAKYPGESIRTLNVAMDCVVNDTLVYAFGLPRPSMADQIIWGENVVKCHTHTLDCDTVLAMMPPRLPSGDDFGETLDQHGWNALSPEARDAINNAIRSVARECPNDPMIRAIETATGRALSPGTRSPPNSRMCVDGSADHSVAWARLVREIVRLPRLESDWYRVPNALRGSVWPDVILPETKQAEKPRLVAFIDVSGSIDHELAHKFVSIVRSAHPKFKVDAAIFDTQVHPWDVRSDAPIPHGGGTNFGILESYIQENYGPRKYPRGIFVLTDGEGTLISPQYPNRWMWLLYGACATHCISTMKHRSFR